MRIRRGVVGLVAVVVLVGLIEAWTLAGGDPISHVLAGLPSMLVFLLGFSVGAIAAHAWWPAYRCWPVLHRTILKWGNPETWAKDHAVCWGRLRWLWVVARGRQW